MVVSDSSMRTGGEAVRTHAEERMKVSRNEMMGDRFWMRRGTS